MYDITLATVADVDDISELLQANAPSQGGSLTGEFPPETVARMVSGGMPVIVARREQRLVGVLFSAAKDNAAAPLSVKAMWVAWPGALSAYVYGPVCIADSERGHGLLPRLYEALSARCHGREAVLFIRRDNLPSLRAHERLGMREVAGFTLEGFEYAVYSDGGH
ncbi:N-acetyltransferase [Dyella dinghuensis]|uniref:N-acetyltransferase n=1 Tax=Dyella dinghuensis TaxID=1920169 RepID=A0A432LRB9_9GAMM|nr:N-acetyltransferase [Dyella dinghuensis]RUL62541.1 N-acetyltransferase [Dyella dinghuensis]